MAMTLDGTNGIALGGTTIAIAPSATGYLLTPNRPAFQTNSISFGSLTNVKQPINATATYNQGGCYSSGGTGRFTAPVAGLYHFWAVVAPSSATSSPVAYIWYNGTTQYAITLAYSSSYNGCTAVANVYMNAGDYCQGIIEEWNGTVCSIWNSSWGGFLIS